MFPETINNSWWDLKNRRKLWQMLTIKRHASVECFNFDPFMLLKYRPI